MSRFRHGSFSHLLDEILKEKISSNLIKHEFSL